LVSLEPVMTRLGGEMTLVEITQAIRDVERWWP
jgi:hypothetical protein